MKNYILIVTIFGFSFCNESKKTHQQMFNDFHTFYETKNFEKLNNLLSDDFTCSNLNVLQFQKKEYLAYIKGWNKVFNTKWNIVSYKEENNKITSIEYDTDLFNDFFYETKKTIKYIYTFNKNTIKSIDIDTVIGSSILDDIHNKKATHFYEWLLQYDTNTVNSFGKYDSLSADNIKLALKKYIKFISKNALH